MVFGLPPILVVDENYILQSAQLGYNQAIGQLVILAKHQALINIFVFFGREGTFLVFLTNIEIVCRVQMNAKLKWHKNMKKLLKPLQDSQVISV